MASLRTSQLLRTALVATALLAGLAMPAQAQWSAVGIAGSAKTQAILGGSPSRLAAIMAAQSLGAPQPPMVFEAVAPSAFPLRMIRAPYPAPQPAIARPVSADRPDVFNSVALEVSHSPLDRRWNGVARRAVGGSAASFVAALSGTAQRGRIEAVNDYVNRHVSFVDDIRRYGVSDRWSAASETLASGRGDCEDYALAKMAMLRRAGFADRDLYLVVLKDLVRRADHAVLVVRSEGHFLVLDNGTNQVLDSSEVRDYRPILTFTAGRVFTHGYRREAVAPVTYASASVPTAPIYTAAAPAFAMASSSLPMSMFAAGAAR